GRRCSCAVPRQRGVHSTGRTRERREEGVGEPHGPPTGVHQASFRRSRAAWYSRARRSTTLAVGSTSLTAPTPWPAPQMSRQALVLPEPKFIFDGSDSGRLSGSRPAATMLPLR